MWPDLTQAVVIQPKLNFAFLDGFCIGPCTFKHECVCVCVWTYLYGQAGLEEKERFYFKSFLNLLLRPAGRWFKDSGTMDGVARHSKISSLWMQRIR